MNVLKINKHNWSGEETSIGLYADGKKASIPEYNLKFRVVKHSEFKDEDVNMDETYFTVELNDGCGWEETDWKCVTDNLSNYHYATTWNGELMRESTKDVRVAVAQLLFNVY